MKYALGIDIGGTNSRVSLFDQNYELISKKTISSDPNNYTKTLGELCDFINEIKENYNIVGIGVCAPGPLDLINGTILETPNLPGWAGCEVSKIIEKSTGIRTKLENDANLAGLAEAVVGLGKGHDIVQYLTISTGVGSACVVNGKIFIGSHGFAHEIANVIVNPSGNQKGSLQKGSVESIASGTAITEIAKVRGLDVNHAGEVNDLATKGNEVAKQVMDEAYDALSSCIAAIVAFIDPSIIILGGSVALKIEGFTQKVEEMVIAKVFDAVKPHVKIVNSNLDGDSGILGGAILGFDLEK